MKRICLPRSCLDTEVNIKHRCHQADIALFTIRTVVFRHSQVPTGLKLKFFKTLVISIALSNSEIWTTRQTLLDRLDKWHRLNSPAAQALMLALDVHIRCEWHRGRLPLHWIDIVNDDFATISLSLTEEAKVAEDRGKWDRIVADSVPK